MPSKEHENLAVKAIRWLNSRTNLGSLRAATEVKIGEGYVVDGAALSYLEMRIYRKYCDDSGVKPMIRRYNGIIKEFIIIGEVQRCISCVFEVKISRNDFLGTFGKGKNHENRKTPVAHMHWIVAPRFLVKVEEAPGFWGLLVTSHGGMREVKKPRVVLRTDQQMDSFAHNLIWPMFKSRQQWTIPEEEDKEW